MNAPLDQTLDELRCAEIVDEPMNRLVEDLYARRKNSSEPVWRNWIQSDLRHHQLYRFLLEDPFVRHSAIRPRGYPGDAELLDYIYGSDNVQPIINGASVLGRRLYEWGLVTSAPSAVRNRLKLAATEIDRMASFVSRPHVLSIACGHLREAHYLESLPNQTLGRFVGADQDPLSLALIRREWEHFGVETVEFDARMLVRNGLAKLGRFDFIYALGLYDYLSDKPASRLLAAALDMLNPGGKVWIANFVEETPSAGFMEAVMDWWLIYRSEDELQSLADGLDAAKIGSKRTFVEPEGNVALLEIVRA
jgi:extracellular factor (EF) 3-hydroxypalmitic acid methyl ester biosynthesis protein